MTLDELGRKHGTDKASEGHDYLRVYEALLAPYRASARQVMEIGVRDGPSVRVWQDYFPSAQIIGVDIMESCRAHADDRITIEIGDQSDQRFLNHLKETYRPEIVLDDGSHIWSHQIDTFRAFFPHLPSGGLFICEDVHTSRVNAVAKYGKPYTDTAATYFGKLAAQVGAEGPVFGTAADPELTGFQKQIDWVHFGRRFVAVKKA